MEANNNQQEVISSPLKYNLGITATTSDREKAQYLSSSIQSLIDTIGVDDCTRMMEKIQRHPDMIMKALSMMDDPITSSLIKNLLG